MCVVIQGTIKNNACRLHAGEVWVPSFDHGVGDPVEGDIAVSPGHQFVIAEGNYLLLGAPLSAAANGKGDSKTWSASHFNPMGVYHILACSCTFCPTRRHGRLANGKRGV